MEFKIIFYLTPLYYAVRYNEIEIVKVLLSNPNIDVNLIAILNQIFDL